MQQTSPVSNSPNDEGVNINSPVRKLNWTKAFSRLKKCLLSVILLCIFEFSSLFLRNNPLEVFLGACIIASLAWLYYPIRWIYKGKGFWLIVIAACVIAFIFIVCNIGPLYFWIAVPLGLAWPIRWVYRGLKDIN